MRLLASAAANAIGGRLIGPDVTFDGASFDSRTVRPGELFVPIVADRDGHDYIDGALAAGAAAYLTARTDRGVAGTSIEVDDTALALMRLAGWAEQGLGAQVVAVTGSVGKTSTKDLIAAALGANRRVTANERSFNNEQGLPVTILGAPDDTEVLVVEMGMRGLGEIAALARVAHPSVGVVTSVAASHTERVGGIEGVAHAKRELVESLPADGTAVLNADDARVAAMASACAGSVVTFGIAGDVRVAALEVDRLARPRFELDTPWGSAELALAVSGRHMAWNAAAAVAVAGVVTGSIDAAVGAIAAARISAQRMEVAVTAEGAIVINDAYNANPDSTAAALEALAAMAADRRVAVLGPMGELDDPAAGHDRIARHAERLGIELIAIDTELYGVSPVALDVAVGELAASGAGVAILVKASNSARLWQVADALLDADR